MEQDITKKEYVDISQIKLDKRVNKEYKVEVICDSAVYAKKSEIEYLPGLYYLICGKTIQKKKTLWSLL